MSEEKIGQGKSMPWDISNFTLSYSYSKSLIHTRWRKDEFKEHRGSLIIHSHCPGKLFPNL
jgi:hypothetical protein